MPDGLSRHELSDGGEDRARPPTPTRLRGKHVRDRERGCTTRKGICTSPALRLSTHPTYAPLFKFGLGRRADRPAVQGAPREPQTSTEQRQFRSVGQQQCAHRPQFQDDDVRNTGVLLREFGFDVDEIVCGEWCARMWVDLRNISHSSSVCCSQNFSSTSCPETMAKRMQEQK